MLLKPGEKHCFKCDLVKLASEFYRHKCMKDGLLGKCKSCTKSDAAEWREKNLERARTYDIERSKRPGRKARMAIVIRRQKELGPKACKARQAVANALKSGRLSREACETCGEKKVHAHHDDYDKSLQVRWLCVPHHSQWHRDNGPGLNFG